MSAWPWPGWLVLFLCTLARTLKSFGQNNTLFLSVEGIQEDLRISRTALGVLFAVACVVRPNGLVRCALTRLMPSDLLQASSAIQPYLGRLQDARGGRVTVPVALLVLALSLWGLACSTRLWHVLLAFLGLRTAGFGALDTFTSSTVTQWFTLRRGFALGLMTFGYYVGTGAFTVQVLAAVQRSTGSWRAGLAVGGAICTVAAPLCAAGIVSTPELAGVRPDPPPPAGGAAGPAPAAGATPAAAEAVDDTASVPLAIALRTVSFWSLLAITFAYFFVASGTDFHLIGIAQERGPPGAAYARPLNPLLSACHSNHRIRTQATLSPPH